MADKKSTLVLTVDLDCKKCCKKIIKTLCKFKEIEEKIFDEKQKKVTISGSFNPECLIKELYCKLGCKIIKGYEIPKPEKKEDKKDKKDEAEKPEPCKQPIYVGPVYVAPICICGRSCGGACTWRERGWCRPSDDEVCSRREGCCSPCCDGRPCDGICRKRDNCWGPCRDGRPCDGICRKRDNCCGPCREGCPICTKGCDGNIYRFCSEEDSTCKPM